MDTNDLGNNKQEIKTELNNGKNNIIPNTKKRGRPRKKDIPIFTDDNHTKKDKKIDDSQNIDKSDYEENLLKFEEEEENNSENDDTDDLYTPVDNNNNDNDNSSLYQNKRGRKRKSQQTEDDKNVQQISTNEEEDTITNAPKKRGRKKKIKDDSSSDLNSNPSNPNTDIDNAKRTNKRRKIKKEEIDDTQDTDTDIKNGINDLTNLPIELLRMELVQRGYHEGVINRLDKWYLVSMLRETAFNHFNYFSFCHSRFGLNSWDQNDGPMEKIFENDPETERKRLEEQRLKKEEKEKEEENVFDDNSIDPNEFSKEKLKKSNGRFKRMYEFF